MQQENESDVWMELKLALDPEVYQKLKQHSSLKNLSVSELLHQLIYDFLQEPSDFNLKKAL